MPNRLLAHEDNAVGNLSTGISAATLTIPLDSGDGALFPTTISGAATSGGDANTLNDTGIGASGIAVGDVIENITDGSYAIVLSVSTNTIETTPLVGGSGNTWDNADVWIVNRFVITVIKYDTDGTTILQREKMLIDSRSSDTLTVNASGRGYDGSSAQSFATGDYVYQFTMAVSFDGVRQVISDIMRTANTLADLVATKVTNTGAEVYAASAVGTDAYAITPSPAIGAYVAGLDLKFLVDVPNTGTATLNVNGLGARTIVKTDGVTTLTTGDLPAGCVAHVIYDAAGYFQLQTPPALTLTNALVTEVSDFFNATDATGAEMETLTTGATSNADAKHTHNPIALDDALFAGGVIHLPVFLENDAIVLSGAYHGASRIWKRPGSVSFMLDNSNSKAALRTDGVDAMAGAVGDDGIFENSSGTPLNLSKTFTAKFKFRFGVVPAGADTFFVGFASSANTLDTSFALPTTDTHIGYQWNGTNWRISNADATTQKTTNVATPAVGWHELKIVRIASTSIEFILDGTSLGTHTLNLPGSGSLIPYFVFTDGAGTTKYVEMSRWIDMYVPTT